jgi:hypothetical protein
MSKRVPRKKVDFTEYKKFQIVADNFYKAAQIASEYEYYNAAGVLIIHSAIALSDSITIKLSSFKVSGDNHYEILTLLRETLPESNDTRQALNHLEKLIHHKNAVSYSGEIYYKKDISLLWKHFERYKNWADKII